MKTLYILCFLMCIPVLGQAQNQSEEEKIKKVIIGETMAYGEGDIEKWRSTVTQSPQMTYVYGLKDGTKGHVVGFERLEKMMMQWMANKTESTYSTVERTAWNIKINGAVAWVTFKETANINGQISTGEEIRILEKIDGEWKLDLISFIF